jgi:hypothetical protein
LVIAKSRNKTEDLIQKIKEMMGFFNRDTVAKACKSLRSRILDVVAADGIFNKKNYFQYASLQICFYFNKIG